MTDEIKRNIRIYIHHGYSFAEVSKLLGATFSEICRALAEENEEREAFEMAQGKATPKETWEKIAEALRAGGKSQLTIALDHGVSQKTVSKIAQAIKNEGKEKEPAAEATAQGSEENTSDVIISDNTADVKTSEENLSGNEVSDRIHETAICGAVKEAVYNELARLRIRMQDLQSDLDECELKKKLLWEYLGGDESEH